MILKTTFFPSASSTPRLSRLPLGAVRARGWLEEQLLWSQKSLAGQLWHLRGICLEGESVEDWREAAALMEAALPVALISGQDKLVDFAKAWGLHIINAQRADGSFAPGDEAEDEAQLQVLRALRAYFESAADNRIIAFLWKFFGYLNKLIEITPFEEARKPYAGEYALEALWLYGITGEKALFELADKLFEKTADWTGFCHTFAQTRASAQLFEQKPTPESMPEAYFKANGPALAMGLKIPAAQAQISGSQKALEAFDVAYAKLMRHHGVATGAFTADEYLAGASPSQGTGIKTIGALLHTLEWQLWLTGESRWMDVLEKLTLNALAAAVDASGHGVQGLMQVNQVAAGGAEGLWYSADEGEHLFKPGAWHPAALEVHKGFMRYAGALWMATEDGGFAALSYAPNQLRFAVGTTPVRISVSGGYPYQGEVRLEVRLKEPMTFPLYLAIPAWAEGSFATVAGERIEGKPGTLLKLERLWQPGDTIDLSLAMQPKLTQWYHKSLAAECGPLVFALPLEAEWEETGESFAATSAKKWQYALKEDAKLCLSVEPERIARFGAAEDAPAHISLAAHCVDEWSLKKGAAAAPPVLPKTGDAQSVALDLVPFGWTALRIAQFPQAR